MKRRNFSMGKKIVLLLFIGVVLPVGASGGFVYEQTVSHLTNIDRQNMLDQSDATETLIDKVGLNLMGAAKSDSYWLDALNAVEKRDANWISQNINTAVGTVAGVDFVSTVDLNGQVLSSAGNASSFTTEINDSYLLARMQNPSNFSGVMTTPKGVVLLAISKVTNDRGTAKPVGSLIFGHYLTAKDLQAIKATLRTDIAVVPDGPGFVSTSQSIIESALKKQGLATSGFKSRRVGGRTMGEVYAKLHGIAGRPVALLYIERPLSATDQVSHQFAMTTLRLGVILFLILAAVTYLLTRLIRRPIRELERVMVLAESGDLTVRGHSKSADEFGHLTDKFNSMLEKFRSFMSQVNENAVTLSASSEQLAASAEETSQATQQIATSVQQIASGSDIQLNHVDGLRAATRDVEGLITSLTANAEQVTHSAGEASSLAENGEVVIRSSVHQMESIRDTMMKVTSVVQTLGERSTSIGQIVELITEIADQTNLLALNAAIEAARAGEYGRGFAVVADEVRKLAEQSRQMAAQISESIHLVQQDISQAVQSAEEGATAVETGIHVTNEAGESFEGILRSVEKVAEEIQGVFAAAKVAQESKEITQATTAILELAEANANWTKNASVLTEEQIATMEEVAASANSLSQMAEHLQEMVSQFRV